MALTFNYVAQHVQVPQGDASPLLVQTLLNAIRAEEASERGITYSQIADASGKETLKSGVMTGITLALRAAWDIEFAAGAYQASIDGGNIADALNRIVNTGSPQVLILASAASTLVNGNGVAVPSAAENAAAVLAAAQVAPIYSNVKQINAATIYGSGTDLDPWREAP